MDQIKIVFFDIDETLINIGAKGLSTKTKEMLQRLQEKGIKICIATGRSPMELPDFSGVEFDAYLIYNDIEMPETVGTRHCHRQRLRPAERNCWRYLWTGR